MLITLAIALPTAKSVPLVSPVPIRKKRISCLRRVLDSDRGPSSSGVERDGAHGRHVLALPRGFHELTLVAALDGTDDHGSSRSADQETRTAGLGGQRVAGGEGLVLRVAARPPRRQRPEANAVTGTRRQPPTVGGEREIEERTSLVAVEHVRVAPLDRPEGDGIARWDGQPPTVRGKRTVDQAAGVRSTQQEGLGIARSLGIPEVDAALDRRAPGNARSARVEAKRRLAFGIRHPFQDPLQSTSRPIQRPDSNLPGLPDGGESVAVRREGDAGARPERLVVFAQEPVDAGGSEAAQIDTVTTPKSDPTALRIEHLVPATDLLVGRRGRQSSEDPWDAAVERPLLKDGVWWFFNEGPRYDRPVKEPDLSLWACIQNLDLAPIAAGVNVYAPRPQGRTRQQITAPIEDRLPRVARDGQSRDHGAHLTVPVEQPDLRSGARRGQSAPIGGEAQVPREEWLAHCEDAGNGSPPEGLQRQPATLCRVRDLEALARVGEGRCGIPIELVPPKGHDLGGGCQFRLVVGPLGLADGLVT